MVQGMVRETGSHRTIRQASGHFVLGTTRCAVLWRQWGKKHFHANPIPLTYAGCHYGRPRPYFMCTVFHKRVRQLAWRRSGKGFLPGGQILSMPPIATTVPIPAFQKPRYGPHGFAPRGNNTAPRGRRKPAVRMVAHKPKGDCGTAIPRQNGLGDWSVREPSRLPFSQQLRTLLSEKEREMFFLTGIVIFPLSLTSMKRKVRTGNCLGNLNENQNWRANLRARPSLPLPLCEGTCNRCIAYGTDTFSVGPQANGNWVE